VLIGEPLCPEGKTAKELAAEFEDWIMENKHLVGIV
jgi:hypothetical protein